MRDLTNLLEYQKNALEVQTIENKFKKSQVRSKLMKARKYLMNSQELMKRYEDDENDMAARFKMISKQLENASEVLEDINDSIENVMGEDSMTQIKMLEKNAKEQQDKIFALEKDMRNCMSMLEKINVDLDKLAINVPRAKKEYIEMKEKYDAELAEVNEMTLPYKKQLKVLEADIDAGIIKKFNQVAKSYPIVLVEMKGRMCTGCNMELPATYAKKIAEADLPLECENCGRLLYVKE